MIVGADAFFSAEISGLSHRGLSTGRLSVELDGDLPVDHNAIPLKQCLSLTRC